MVHDQISGGIHLDVIYRSFHDGLNKFNEVIENTNTTYHTYINIYPVHKYTICASWRNPTETYLPNRKSNVYKCIKLIHELICKSPTFVNRGAIGARAPIGGRGRRICHTKVDICSKEFPNLKVNFKIRPHPDARKM